MTEATPRLDGETESIRTVYMSEENHEALRSMADASDSTGSAILRKIFDDYLAGKLAPSKEAPRKTSVWISPDLWDQVKLKTAEDRIPIAKVIDAGMRRLRGQR